MKAAHALDLDRVPARAAHAAAHGIDEVLQVHDFRFPCGVMDSRDTRHEYRRHHDVFRCADAGVIEMHLARVHTASIAMDEPTLLLNLHAEAAQTGQMQINRTEADLTAAGKSNGGLMKSCQNRPQQENGRANLLRQLIRHFPRM